MSFTWLLSMGCLHKDGSRYTLMESLEQLLELEGSFVGINHGAISSFAKEQTKSTWKCQYRVQCRQSSNSSWLAAIRQQLLAYNRGDCSSRCTCQNRRLYPLFNYEWLVWLKMTAASQSMSRWWWWRETKGMMKVIHGSQVCLLIKEMLVEHDPSAYARIFSVSIGISSNRRPWTNQ